MSYHLNNKNTIKNEKALGSEMTEKFEMEWVFKKQKVIQTSDNEIYDICIP